MAANGFQHLTLDERRSLFRMQEARLGIAEMAVRLGRHRSTIYRELGRNRFRDADASRDSRRNMSGYYPVTAQDLARARWKRLAKLARHEGLLAHVVDRLRVGWLPQQIAGRLRQEAGADGEGSERLCHETIYRHVYGPEGQAEQLHLCLLRARRRRGTRHGPPAARASHSAGARDCVPSGGGCHAGELRPLRGRPAGVRKVWRQRQRDDTAGAPQPVPGAAAQPGPAPGRRSCSHWHSAWRLGPGSTFYPEVRHPRLLRMLSSGDGHLRHVHSMLVGMLRSQPDTALDLIVDSCSVRAKRSGELTGPNPTDRAKKGTKYHVAVNGDGLPVACVVTAANVPDTVVFERLFRAAFVVVVRVRTAFADKGYDAEANRDLCRTHGTEPRSHKRGQPHGSGLGRRRWPVERANAWLLDNKRLGLRYDRLGFIVESLLQAACIFLVAPRLAREF